MKGCFRVTARPSLRSSPHDVRRKPKSSTDGTDRYNALAVELAAGHGFKITNPEMQRYAKR